MTQIGLSLTYDLPINSTPEVSLILSSNPNEIVSHFSSSSGSIRQHQYGRFTTRRIVDWDEYGVEEWVRKQTWKCMKYLGKSLFLLLQININKHKKHTRDMATKCTHNSACSVIHQQPTATGTDDGVLINI